MQAENPYSRVSITDVMKFAVSSAHVAIDSRAHSAPQPSPESMGWAWPVDHHGKP
jgi:hypothetical protein